MHTTPSSGARPGSAGGSGSRRPGRARWAALALAVAVVPVAGPALAGPTAAAPAPAAGAAAPLLTRPNVVLIVTDDQALDSIAKMDYVSSRKDWIRFDKAWIENSMCCPSRVSILTGQYDTHTGVSNNGQTNAFDQSQSLAVWMQQAGYRTGLVGKYVNNYPQAFRGATTPFVPPGWSAWQAAYGNVRNLNGKVIDTLYDQYGYEMSDNGRQVSMGFEPQDYQVSVLTRRAKSFIADSAGKPFFLYFTPTATHGPWVASPTRAGSFAGEPVVHTPSFNEADVSDKPRHVRQLPTVDVRTADASRRLQWAGAASVDDAVRALDEQLKASGVYDNTVVIFMTDNGYTLGEHRLKGKRCEYFECGRTPLLVRYPGRSATTVDKLVSNVDIASTIAQLGGTRPAIAQDGRSIVPLITGRPVAWRDAVLTHWPGDFAGDPDVPGYVPQFWGVHTSRYTYVEIPSTGEKELYDTRTDPHELRNLAGKPAVRAVQAQLQIRLAALRRDATEGGTTSAAPTTSLLVAQDLD